jgi:hypothetical protein
VTYHSLLCLPLFPILIHRFQKWLRSEPGSSTIFLDAAAQPSPVDSNTVMFRKTAVYKQLSDRHLTYADVTGDGNCFYRALSCTLHGNESQHAELRRLVADHLFCTTPVSSKLLVTSLLLKRTMIDQRVQRMHLNGA